MKSFILVMVKVNVGVRVSHSCAQVGTHATFAFSYGYEYGTILPLVLIAHLSTYGGTPLVFNGSTVVFNSLARVLFSLAHVSKLARNSLLFCYGYKYGTILPLVLSPTHRVRMGMPPLSSTRWSDTYSLSLMCPSWHTTFAFCYGYEYGTILPLAPSPTHRVRMGVPLLVYGNGSFFGCDKDQTTVCLSILPQAG